MRKKKIADNQFTFSVKTEDPDIFSESVSVFGVNVSRFRRKSCQNHYFETDANPVLWAGILLLAAAGAGTAVVYRRKADH